MTEDTRDYWTRYGLALGVGIAMAAFTDFEKHHGLVPLLLLAAFGRMSDVASTVRMLHWLPDAGESAPGLQGKPHPWRLFRLGLAQIAWLTAIATVLDPFAHVLVGKALVAISVVSFAISASNYGGLYAHWSLSVIKWAQWTNPLMDWRAPYRLRAHADNLSWMTFMLGQPVGIVFVHGLLATPAGWTSWPACVLLVVATHAMFRLAQHLYFTAPWLHVARMKRLEREAVERIPETLAHWPERRPFHMSMLGKLTKAEWRRLMPRNRAAVALICSTYASRTADGELMNRLRPVAPNLSLSPGAPTWHEFFDLRNDPYSDLQRLHWRSRDGVRHFIRKAIPEQAWERWRALQSDARHDAEVATTIARFRFAHALQAAAEQKSARGK